jgi:hypothetical protein
LKTQICFHRKRRHTRNHTHHMPKCLTFFYSYISEAVFYAGCSKYQKGLSQATWARGFNHFLNPQQHIQHDSKKTDFELQNVCSYCKMLQKSILVQLWSIGHWLLGLMCFFWWTLEPEDLNPRPWLVDRGTLLENRKTCQSLHENLRILYEVDGEPKNLTWGLQPGTCE